MIPFLNFPQKSFILSGCALFPVVINSCDWTGSPPVGPLPFQVAGTSIFCIPYQIFTIVSYRYIFQDEADTVAK